MRPFIDVGLAVVVERNHVAQLDGGPMHLVERVGLVPIRRAAPQTHGERLRRTDLARPLERQSHEPGRDFVLVLELERAVAVAVEVVRLR